MCIVQVFLHFSMNKPYMTKVKEKVAVENVGMAKRLESIKPTYKAKAWVSHKKKCLFPKLS